MKIVAMEITVQKSPPSRQPIRDALQALPGAGSVQVTVRSEDGVEGSGRVGFGRIAGAPDALAAILEHELRPLVIGSELTAIPKTREALLREIEYHGLSGLATFGIAAIDTALWDCWGKTLEKPCWQLWGAVHDRIPAYAMVGWMNYSDAEVQQICARALEQGFRAVKIKVGYPTLREDLHRIRVVREAIGEEIRLMVDANQVLRVDEAIQRGRAYQDLGVFWWEEPIPAHDLFGYRRLTQALDIAVATGENLYTAADFARFLQQDAVDIVQPDLRRMGGPTGLLQVGLLADAFGKPYASHGGGPVQLNVMAHLPNALYLETGLLPKNAPQQLIDGCMPVPTGPGFSWE